MKILVSGFMNNGNMDRAAKKLLYVGYTPVVLHIQEGMTTANWMKERLGLYPECDGIYISDEFTHPPFNIEKALFDACGKLNISKESLDQLVINKAVFFDETITHLEDIMR